MSALSEFETAMANLVAERTTGDDERWPITSYVCYVVTIDPETMRFEEPVWLLPDGQSEFLTRGIIVTAHNDLNNVQASTYAEWTDDDDD